MSTTIAKRDSADELLQAIRMHARINKARRVAIQGRMQPTSNARKRSTLRAIRLMPVTATTC